MAADENERTLTAEECDILERSIKKPNGGGEGFSNSSSEPVSYADLDEGPEGGEKGFLDKSFVSALRGDNGDDSTGLHWEEVDLPNNKDSGDGGPFDSFKGITVVEKMSGHFQCPEFILDEEEKQRIRRPWRNGIIVKMLGRRIGFKALENRLKQLWVRSKFRVLADSPENFEDQNHAPPKIVEEGISAPKNSMDKGQSLKVDKAKDSLQSEKRKADGKIKRFNSQSLNVRTKGVDKKKSTKIDSSLKGKQVITQDGSHHDEIVGLINVNKSVEEICAEMREAILGNKNTQRTHKPHVIDFTSNNTVIQETQFVTPQVNKFHGISSTHAYHSVTDGMGNLPHFVRPPDSTPVAHGQGLSHLDTSAHLNEHGVSHDEFLECDPDGYFHLKSPRGSCNGDNGQKKRGLMARLAGIQRRIHERRMNKFLYRSVESNTLSAPSSASHTWRAIVSSWSDVVRGERWVVGNGSNINVWTDSWLPHDHKLMDLVPSYDPAVEGLRVSNLTTPSGQWDWSLLNSILPSHIVDSLKAILPPASSLGQDRRVWYGHRLGLFSISSSYSLISNHGDSFGDEPWSKIWKLSNAERVRVFVWQVAHGRLMMNERKARWGIGSPCCFRCPGVSESILHILRDYPFASAVWGQLVSVSKRPLFYAGDLSEWCCGNFRSDFGMHSSHPWTEVWAQTCYQLWRWRNEALHNQDFNPPLRPWIQIQNQVDFYLSSGHSLGSKVGRSWEEIAVRWIPPPLDWAPPQVSELLVHDCLGVSTPRLVVV
ncbi:hypothetical protein RIF29_39176 [Crotalaria pallida]|uniref:Reverse transcriptase zinc-binding domain-containing protein n=1 Tax=Crotalaria pallida TaxID=3830 RepID=A0AAN9E1B9_CROPI